MSLMGTSWNLADQPVKHADGIGALKVTHRVQLFIALLEVAS